MAEPGLPLRRTLSAGHCCALPHRLVPVPQHAPAMPWSHTCAMPAPIAHPNACSPVCTDMFMPTHAHQHIRALPTTCGKQPYIMHLHGHAYVYMHTHIHVCVHAHVLPAGRHGCHPSASPAQGGHSGVPPPTTEPLSPTDSTEEPQPTAAFHRTPWVLSRRTRPRDPPVLGTHLVLHQ